MVHLAIGKTILRIGRFIMIKQLICIPIVVMLLTPSVVIARPNEQEDTLRQVLLATLSPYISNAVTGYYGEIRQYGLYDAEILNIDRLSEGSYSFKVKVLVKTFVGAHNPPYGDEIITLSVSAAGVSVVQFEHRKG
jgi:hypothetical protein